MSSVCVFLTKAKMICKERLACTHCILFKMPVEKSTPFSPPSFPSKKVKSHENPDKESTDCAKPESKSELKANFAMFLLV